jgi:nitrate reductase gamma subunit
MCYGCGDCSESCPRGADPAAYMASLRRYAIAQYDLTGLTKWIFTNSRFAVILTVILAIVLGFFMLTLKPESHVSRWIFQYMPYEIIHNAGMWIFAIVGIALIIGLSRMLVNLHKRKNKETKVKLNSIYHSILYVTSELGTMKRQQVCDKEEDSVWQGKAWYKKPWFIHYSVMWGFIGLLLATTLDFIFKDPATKVWLPTRILGTIAGLFMMYGATMLIYYRIIKVSKFFASTRWADWYFLIFLWLAGFTGFWMEVSVTLESDNLLSHIIFILHTVLSMELILLFTFSKFAHAIYRPLALFFQYYYYGTSIR